MSILSRPPRCLQARRAVDAEALITNISGRSVRTAVLQAVVALRSSPSGSVRSCAPALISFGQFDCPEVLVACGDPGCPHVVLAASDDDELASGAWSAQRNPTDAVPAARHRAMWRSGSGGARHVGGLSVIAIDHTSIAPYPSRLSGQASAFSQALGEVTLPMWPFAGVDPMCGLSAQRRQAPVAAIPTWRYAGISAGHPQSRSEIVRNNSLSPSRT